MSDEEKKDGKHPLAITKKQEMLFDAMMDADRLCLIGGKYRGQQVSFVCMFSPDADGTGALMRPVAILMDDDFIERHAKDITDPDGGDLLIIEREPHPTTSPGSSEKN